MNSISKISGVDAVSNREIITRKEDSSSICSKAFADEKTIKHSLKFTITKLTSTLEIKQSWLYWEWATACKFSKYTHNSSK